MAQVIPTVHIKHTNMFYMSTVVNADWSEAEIPTCRNGYRVHRHSEYLRQIGTSRNKQIGQ